VTLEERIDLKCEEVECWGEALSAADQLVEAYKERRKIAEWELHQLLKLPDTITDVFDD
jgi:hypothetical protein